MTRLAKLKRHELNDEQRRLFDRIVGSERPGQKTRSPRLSKDGGLEGPFNALLYSAEIGLALQELGDQLRYNSTLSDRCREIAILITAAACDSDFERYAHEDIARAVGLVDHQIEAIRTGHEPDLSDQTERATYIVARGLAERHDLNDAEYREATAALGERALIELVTLVGFYASLALSLGVFRVRAPTLDNPSKGR